EASRPQREQSRPPREQAPVVTVARAEPMPPMRGEERPRKRREPAPVHSEPMTTVRGERVAPVHVQPAVARPQPAPVALQPLALAVPRPVPTAPRREEPILALFDDDADQPTNPKAAMRPSLESFDPLGVSASARAVEPSARPAPAAAPSRHAVADPPSRRSVERPSREATNPPSRHAIDPPSRHAIDPPPRQATEPPSRVGVELPGRRPSRRAFDAPSRPSFDPPSKPPRSATAMDDSAPFVMPRKPRRASTSWQRPLAIETRRPPMSRPVVIAVALLAVAALWLVRPDTPSQLPPAALATAARPSPEPPVTKPEKPPVADGMGEIWIHPLQGPERRMPIHDSRLFGAERLGDRPSECRGGHCGIDLAGPYGEPVYAVHDGVIDRVQRAANEDHGGHYVRIAHNDGTVITQYFHLSSIPRRLEEGARIKAGELVGWIGLSGVKHSEPHLHFTVSVQDPSGADGRYLDPEPLVALWQLRLPDKADPTHLHLSTSAPPGLARGFIRRRHHHRARNVDSAASAE
ncbi:MAG: Peptidase, partial [Myxococcales bacterium]|nr:Peptidase [Myxococcales bacterium]